ncbi:uncharacterized protein [Rutidosis leptorrhynchoides]|uniref:uncharacterized protein n=1 Tax=Rutidosis leptorrhynchoides TaxID=125765 RepID=UPI003A98ED02
MAEKGSIHEEVEQVLTTGPIIHGSMIATVPASDTTQKKKNLIRCYENFTVEPKESLSDLHSRFQKRFGFKKGKGKGTFDPKKAKCFKCGKLGHIAADCWSKGEGGSNSNKSVDKARKYKLKYMKLKSEAEKSKNKE